MVKSTRLGIARVACTVGLAAAVSVSGLPLGAVPAWATGTVKVTASKGNEGVTYQAYQLFTGTVKTVSDEKVLTGIDWSTGAKDAFDAAITSYTPATGENAYSGTTAQDAADYLASMIGEGGTDTLLSPQSFAGKLAAQLAKSTAITPTEFKAGVVSASLGDGYYLIVTKKESLTGNTAATAPVFALVGEGELDINEKTSVPTVTKEVKEDSTGTYGRYADARGGQSIDYQLTATLPTNLESYTTYRLKFVDYLSAGLTYDTRSAKAYVVHPAEEGQAATEDLVVSGFNLGESDTDPKDSDAKDNVYTGQSALVFNASDVCSLELQSGKKVAAGDKVVIRYSAKLNNKAVVGTPGNPNKAKLVYSNDPNSDTTGTTELVDPVVYTYKLNLTKKDYDKKDSDTGDNGLTGAVFTIQLASADDAEDGKLVNQYVQGDGSLAEEEYLFTTGEDGTVSVSGLDDGTYKIHEKTAPAGYALLTSDPTVKVESTLGENGALTLDTDGSGNAYTTVVQSSETGGGTVDVTVRDVKNVGMPQTGSTGFVAMIAGGAALVVASLAALLGRRKADRRS